MMINYKVGSLAWNLTFKARGVPIVVPKNKDRTQVTLSNVWAPSWSFFLCVGTGGVLTMPDATMSTFATVVFVAANTTYRGLISGGLELLTLDILDLMTQNGDEFDELVVFVRRAALGTSENPSLKRMIE